MSEQAPITVNVKEAAHLLGIGEATCQRYVTRGTIPSFKVGTRRLIPVDLLRRWAEQQALKAG